MSTNPGEIRTYTWQLQRPIPQESKECRDFHQYIKDEITGSRELLAFEVITDKDNCIVKIRWTSYSTGNMGPNSFRTKLYLLFPDAESIEMVRERNL